MITRAALEALDDAQLAAVLAHEHAHFAGRHHPVLALTTSLAKALSGIHLFRDGADDVARLLEMCADDASARRHSRDIVVDALLALSLPATSPTVLSPTGALSAAGVGVVQRVERLVHPPKTAGVRLALTLMLAAVLVGPVWSAAIAAGAPMLCAT